MKNLNFVRNNLGKFYAVSTGPASSEYLTLGAVRILEKCNTIFYPITKSGEKENYRENHVAFDCISKVIDISKKNCVGVTFSMTKEKSKTQAEYDEFAFLVENELQKGDVAFITIGDVSVYSTAARLAKMIEKNGHEIKFVAGVPSFCASACECLLDLAEQDEEIRIIPGDSYFRNGKLSEVLKSDGTKIIMKSPKFLKNIIEELSAQNLFENSYLIQGAGYKNQRIFSGEELKSLSEEIFEKAYMSVVIVKEETR